MKIQYDHCSSNAHGDEGKFNIVLILMPVKLVLEQGCRVIKNFMDSHLVINWISKNSMKWNLGLDYLINIVLEHLSDLGKFSCKIEEEGRDYRRHCAPFLSLSVSYSPHSVLLKSLTIFSPHTMLFMTNSFISWKPPIETKIAKRECGCFGNASGSTTHCTVILVCWRMWVL